MCMCATQHFMCEPSHSVKGDIGREPQTIVCKSKLCMTMPLTGMELQMQMHCDCNAIAMRADSEVCKFMQCMQRHWGVGTSKEEDNTLLDARC